MNILLIDDDWVIATLVKQVLSANAYSVDYAASGSKGLVLASENSYNAIILDLGLDDLGGDEVLEQLRARGNNTPVMILTADRRSETCSAMMGKGANGFAVKPIQPNELMSRLRATVRGSRSMPAVGR